MKADRIKFFFEPRNFFFDRRKKIFAPKIFFEITLKKREYLRNKT